jgi:hypothetical protein
LAIPLVDIKKIIVAANTPHRRGVLNERVTKRRTFSIKGLMASTSINKSDDGVPPSQSTCINSSWQEACDQMRSSIRSLRDQLSDADA